ncbi:hypothetical protein GH733_008917, partial [Mirounga leonina]
MKIQMNYLVNEKESTRNLTTYVEENDDHTNLPILTKVNTILSHGLLIASLTAAKMSRSLSVKKRETKKK